VILQSRPVTFQDLGTTRSNVASGFVIDGNGVRFEVGAYDRSKPLTIDPTVALNNLAYSTFLGGTLNDVGEGIATDTQGNVYVTGYTQSVQFPTTSGVFDTTQNSNSDVFVAKLNPGGSALIYSTFIGGSGNEEGRAIKVDSSGHAYVTGYTGSSAFPVTSGSYDTTANGSADAFVLKLNPDGSALSYSTLIGGTGFDEAYDLALDANNDVFVVGQTNSATFPTTASAFQTTYGGMADAFLAHLDSTGATLMYSSFLGGNANDYGEDVALDLAGNAYVTGFTASTNFPTTAGVLLRTYQGGTNDMFVAKVNTALSGASSLIYSTYLGGTDSDAANAITVDASGNATVVGTVLNGGGFPFTTGAYDTTHNGAIDVVVAQLNAIGSALIFSIYIGSTISDIGSDIAQDAFGNFYITGYTVSGTTNYPTTPGAYDTTQNGGHDVFLSKLSANGSLLLYSTLLGGSGDDDANALALDGDGNFYLTGLTNATATNLPVTGSAFQTTHGGGQDAFIAKFGHFAIGGRVIDATTGDPLPNVRVALSGDTSGSMFSGADGRFGFTNALNYRSYLLAASGAGLNINPGKFDIYLDGNRDLIFLAQTGYPSLLADLAISKSDGVSTVYAGGTVTYTTLASNLGGNDVVGGKVTDTFPAILGCTWTCVGLGGGTCSASGSGNINDSVHLPPGGGAVYTAQCSISPLATGTLSDTAAVLPPAQVSDPVPDNNSSTDVDNIVPDVFFIDDFD